MLKTARAVHPSYAVRLRYQRQIQKMIRRMAVSVEYWVKAWREAEPPQMAQDEWKTPVPSRGITQSDINERIAQDSLPATEMLREFRKLATRWRKHFDEMAPTVAEIFLKNQFKGTDVAFKEALKAAGWAVEFKLTKAMRDAFEAKLAENVGLIRSIPEQYLAEVEGIVMRNYASGRDVASMAKEIRGRYKVASDRAVLIARDQSNKANAVVQRARRKELGITEAIWLHSHAGKEPRPTHEAFNRKRFDVEKGMWDKDANGKGRGAWVFPGELINCFPGDSKVQFADGVLKAYRRFYRGELAEIVTNTGKSVRATMNHPVLTPDGWVALGLLNEGDDILCVSNDGLGRKPLLSSFSSVVKKNVDGAVTTFAEVFSSISKSGGIGYSKVSHAGQFHGDGGSDGDVDVVLSARPLRFGVDPARKKNRKQLALSMPNYAALSLRSVLKFAAAPFHAANRLMRSLGQSLAPSNTFALHPYPVGIASSSDGAARKLYASYDGLAVNPVPFSQSENAQAILMFAPKTERIVKVNRVPFEGFVYNLETRHGFYLTGNIIAHNCRCVSRSVLPWTPNEPSQLNPRQQAARYQKS